MILNQHCVVGNETALLLACLAKDGFTPQNLKKVCLEVGLPECRLIIHISTKREKHRKRVWPGLGQDPNESHANHNNIQIFTGGAKALTWTNLGFPHFFQYIKSVQTVPGIHRTTFRQKGPQICLAEKPQVHSQAL